jgi:hypothetical protein
VSLCGQWLSPGEQKSNEINKCEAKKVEGIGQKNKTHEIKTGQARWYSPSTWEAEAGGLQVQGQHCIARHNIVQGLEF